MRKLLPIFISPITPRLGKRGSSLLAPGITIVANCPLQLHRQIFFTDGILTGGSASCCLPRVRHPGGQPPSHGAHQLFLTNRTLTGGPASVLRRAIGRRHRRNPARGPITTPSRIHRKPTIIWCDAPLATPHQAFLTDRTLTGSGILRLLNGTMVGLIADKLLPSQCRFDSKEISHYKCPL